MLSIETIIKAITLAVLGIAELAAYLIIVGTVLPKCFMRVRCSVKESGDRGIKKYVYPEGRGIAYEPQPSVRKYIHRYVLFVSEGYKYLKCRLDEGVKDLGYTVVMFNRKNKVIDVIDVYEKGTKNAETGAVNLHGDTSYISLIPNSVNGKRLHVKKLMYRKIGDVCWYGALLSVLTFIQMNLTVVAVRLFAERFLNLELVLKAGVLDFILPSLLIGGAAVGLIWIFDRRKGLRWSAK